MNRLDADLREEAIEKINLLKDIKNHRLLRVHKLHGPLSDWFSFSVNYVSKTEVALLSIGDHDVYN